MNEDKPPLRLALIGDPVEHSASPALHRQFMRQTGIEGSYEAIRVPAGGAAEAIVDLRVRGYRGLNVTTPLKEEAFEASERLEPVAQAARSVNTIVFENGAIVGLNTDAIALSSVILDVAGREPGDGMQILVLGAGPTARSVAFFCARFNAGVSIWNRNKERAQTVADAFHIATYAPAVHYDVVFSALAPDPDLPDDLMASISKADIVIDANYGPRATLARRFTRPVIDGTAMLRFGALASYSLFTQPALDLERFAFRAN